MKTALWHGKRSIKQWQLQKQQDGHNQRIKNVRPTTHDWQWEPHTLNQNKRLMLQENKFTEIERQNRYLLQKITHRMNKSITQRESDKEKMNRSLNAPFRRKQLENIEVQNARLLKRLQERKSEYERDKMKQMWKQQVKVIKNIAHYPFIIRTSFKGKKRAVSKAETQAKYKAKSNFDSDIELMRVRNIDGQNFVVTVRFIEDKVYIYGDHKKNKQKIIEIPKQEAIAFIEYECEGKLQGIFDRLSYDKQEDVLYLIGKQGMAGMQMKTIEERPLANEQSKVSNF